MAGFAFGQGSLQLWQQRQAIAQPGQVPGPCRAQPEAGEDSLQVADVFQQLEQGLEMIVYDQRCHRLLPQLQLSGVPQRAIDPAG